MTIEDVLTVTQGTDSEDDYYASLQRMINAGSWSFEGSVGRAMMQAIEVGDCMLGTKPARDAYSNFIPSRTLVQSGTKGSWQFVVDAHGEDYANRMAQL